VSESKVVLDENMILQNLEEIVNRNVKEVLDIYGPLLLKLAEKCEPARYEYWNRIISSLRDKSISTFERLRRVALVKKRILDLIGEPCVNAIK
jgi:hypothetical protein